MATATNRATQENAEDTHPITIGVLALQGDYEAHARAFDHAGARTVLVRKPEELKGLDGLVLPGGESTTMLKFLEKHGFFDTLGEFVLSTPCFATCAGCILVAREVLHPKQRSLGVLDATVERNAYGRQIDSAILTLPTKLPGGPLEMVFIRAPRITRVGPGVKVLAERDVGAEGDGWKQVTAELSLERSGPERYMSCFALFLEMVRRHKKASRQSESVPTLPHAPQVK